MRVVSVLLMALLMAISAIIHERIDRARAQWTEGAELTVLPAPRHLELMSVGYREALADLIWIRALVFTGRRLGHADDVMVERYVEAITALAPRFRRPYLWGGITAIYGGSGTIERPMVERSARIYRAGLEQFPTDHELLYALGMLLTNQVGSVQGYSTSDKNAAKADGVELIRAAAAYGADPLVRRYAATLITDHATDQLALQFLESQLVETDDEDHRRLLRRKISQLASREVVAQIERIREEFTREHRSRFGYLPDALYAVIRAEPGPLDAPPP